MDGWMGVWMERFVFLLGDRIARLSYCVCVICTCGGGFP